LVVVVVFVVGGGGGGGGLILFFVGLVFLWYVYICYEMPCTYCGWISIFVFIYIYIYRSFMETKMLKKE
jgi:hypothetical protein